MLTGLLYASSFLLPIGFVASVWVWNRQFLARVSILQALRSLRRLQLALLGFCLLNAVIFIFAGCIHAWGFNSVFGAILAAVRPCSLSSPSSAGLTSISWLT